MQYELETTDISLDLFGSEKSKLIDKGITTVSYTHLTLPTNREV